MTRSAWCSITVATAFVSASALAQPPPAKPPRTVTEETPAEAPSAAPQQPPIYYVEPATVPSAPPPPEPPVPGAPPPGAVLEPPIPGQNPQVVWEPPPPPLPRHVAPRTSLWLGARVGWFVPFGYLYRRTIPVAPGVYRYDRVEWHDHAGSGPMLELDVGARLSRHYNLFALWEHAELSAGAAEPDLFGASEQSRGNTDFWGLGVRASSDADEIGFLSELALGYRRAQSNWEDGAELELESGFIEARLGFGADIRVNEFFSLSPLLTLGVGTFADADFVDSQGRRMDRIGRGDEYDSHGWLTFQLGAHVDAFGQK